MNRLISACAGAVIAALVPLSAGFADETAVKAKLSPVSYNWSGWYAGANAGYGFSNSATNIAGLNPSGAALVAIGVVPSTLNEHRTGSLVGFQLGANLQSGHIVYGFETDIDYASSTGNANSATTFAGLIVTTSSETKLSSFGTFRGRLGVAAFERSLFYATGGLAYGRVTSSLNAVTNANGACDPPLNLCASPSSQKWMAGWTLGAGWEWAFASKWSTKVEYLYYDIGKLENNFEWGPGLLRSSNTVNGSIVRIGLNYKFGGL